MTCWEIWYNYGVSVLYYANVYEIFGVTYVCDTIASKTAVVG